MANKRSSSQLCSDIVLEILSRLPDKSLFRFRCVSKLWCYLIDANLRWRAMPLTMTGFLYECPFPHIRWFLETPSDRDLRRHPIMDSSFSFLLELNGEVIVFDSCNGLFLCAFLPEDQPKHSLCFVCNPATKRWDWIPELGIRANVLFMVFLVFDPSISLHYKVFMLCEDLEENTAKIGVFFSEDRSWRTLGMADSYSRSGRKVYLHEKVYIPSFSRLLIIDVREGTFELIGMPIMVAMREQGFYYCFALLEEEVCCGTIFDNGMLGIWVLVTLENGHEWVLKHWNWVKEFEQGDIYGFHQNLDIVFIEIKNRVLAYCLKTKTLRDVGRLESPEKFVRWEPYSYSPCLVDLLGKKPLTLPIKEFEFD